MGFNYPVGILGAGAWGTALANHLAQNCGHNVLLWSYDEGAAKDIQKKRENTPFLPGISLSENITVTTNPEDVATQCEIIIYATPSAYCHELAVLLAPLLKPEQILVMSAKGFREADGALLTDVWQEAAPHFQNFAVLSGPTFASELAEQKPVTSTLASEDEDITMRVDNLFSSKDLRLYYGDDIIGSQVGGALKNTIAIAAGISDGLALGGGFKAALLCRGVVEMMRYAESLGGKRLTLSGLSGVGDLLMTASETSRNYRFGYLLGQGKSTQEAEKEIGATIEGIATASIVTMQGVARGIDMGVLMAIHGILNGDLNPRRTFQILLYRPRVNEFDTHDTID